MARLRVTMTDVSVATCDATPRHRTPTTPSSTLLPTKVPSTTTSIAPEKKAGLDVDIG
eukprot:gene19370-14012_t